MRANLHSWIDPNGQVYVVSGSHNLIAYHICRDLKIDTKSPYHELMEKGWMRVTYISKSVYVNNHTKFINYRQRREIVDLAIECKMEKIIFDNDEDDKEIWNQND